MPQDMSGAGQPGRGASDVDVIVVGAGFAGMYLLHRLRKLGMTALVFEAGSGVGGTWYWNRYPGARCDVESMQYSYAFSEELQQEWHWPELFSAQPDILAYANHVADRFDLRRDITFNTRVTSAHWNPGADTWTVGTDTGETVTARHVVMATGCLSSSRMPDIEGRESFKGRTFHTGQWPHEKVDFTGRTVAVIGTGSSGIQVAPMIAAEAAELTVFQRTPNFSIPAWNQPLPRSVQDEWKKHYPRHRAAAKASRSGALYDYSQRSAFDMTAAERQAELDARWARGGANFTHCFNDMFRDKAANDIAADYVRNKIGSIVQDWDKAALLMPTDHAIGTKRICVDTDYYAMFNRPNVTLVDVRATPITRITTTGIATSAADHAFDSIVFATGYDAVTGSLTRIDIIGRSGVGLKDKWRDGPKSYLGIMVADYPNLFTITGPGSPSILTNVVMSIEQHVEWVADCLGMMARTGADLIEPELAAEDEWVAHVADIAAQTLHVQANSWYMGANVPGKPRVFLPYIGGLGTYTQICNEIARDGYRGFVIR